MIKIFGEINIEGQSLFGIALLYTGTNFQYLLLCKARERCVIVFSVILS